MPALLSNTDILVALCLLVAVFIAGIISYKKSTEEEYLIASRRIGTVVLGGTMAVCIIGGGVILLFSQYAYEYGVTAFAIFGGLGIGLAALIFITKHYKPQADEQHFYTIPDLFSFQWGKTAGFIATLVVIGWAFGFVIMQLISSGILLEELLPLPYELCVILSVIIVLIYLIAAGFRAVVVTDVIQYAALALFLIIIAIFAIPKVDYVTISKHFGQMGLADALGFFVLGALNITVSADLWQRIYSAKSEKAAVNGIVLTIILMLLIGGLLFVTALYAKSLSIEFEPNRALILGLTILPRGILGVAFAAILFAVISTLDTMVFILGISIANDIWIRFLSRPAGGRVRSVRLWMILISAVGAFVAIINRDLLQTGLALSSLGLSLTPAVLIGMRWKLHRSTVIGSLSGGILIFVLLLLSGKFTPANSVATLPGSIIGAIAGSIFWRIRRK
jgi:SSS family solute:Na+ symporter